MPCKWTLKIFFYIILIVCGRELLVSAIRREQPCGRWIISYSRMWLSFSQVSYFIPNIDRNLAFRGCFSMMELASSTTWYVYLTFRVDIYRLIVNLKTFRSSLSPWTAQRSMDPLFPLPFLLTFSRSITLQSSQRKLSEMTATRKWSNSILLILGSLVTLSTKVAIWKKPF